MILALIVNAGVVLFVVWAGAWMRRRRRKLREKSRGLVVSPMAGLALGAMLLGFQAIVQPGVRHAMVEEQKEESIDDGDPEPLGGREFHEQLRKIRLGEDVDALMLRTNCGPTDTPPSDEGAE